MGQDLFSMGGNGSLPGKPLSMPFNFSVAFGESGAAINCSSCNALDNRGFFVMQGSKALLICIKCVVRAIDKYQQTHPMEKIFDVDVDVDDKEYQKAADAVRDKRPDLSESEALEIAKAAIRAI